MSHQELPWSSWSSIASSPCLGNQILSSRGNLADGVLEVDQADGVLEDMLLVLLQWLPKMALEGKKQPALDDQYTGCTQTVHICIKVLSCAEFIFVLFVLHLLSHAIQAE